MESSYTTVGGDTWDAIAHKKMGSCSYTNLLMQSNKNYIGTAIFSPGIVLSLPTITESTTAKNLPPWKK